MVVFFLKKKKKVLHAFVVGTVVLSCTVCKKPISGSFTTADGQSFHNSCFTCATCHRVISGSFFRSGNNIFCSDDIPISNSLSCYRCNETIELGTNYVECKSQTYHRYER
jgi:hypothetical protein